jgi:hypothetical protein
MTLFRVEIFSNDGYTCDQNTRKILAQKNVSFGRCWIPKIDSFAMKHARMSSLLEIQYLVKGTFSSIEVFEIF